MTSPIEWISVPNQYTSDTDAEFRWSVPDDLGVYYKLAPIEQNWQGPIMARQLVYRELPEGEYVFSLAICEHGGTLGLTDDYKFYVVQDTQEKEPVTLHWAMPPIEVMSQPIDIKPGKAMRSADFNDFVHTALNDIETLIRAQASMRGYIGETRTMWTLEVNALSNALDELESVVETTIPSVLEAAVSPGQEFTWPVNICNLEPGIPDSLTTWFDDVGSARIDKNCNALTANLMGPPAERFAYRHPISGEVYTRSDVTGYVNIMPAGHNIYFNNPSNAINYNMATAWTAAISQPQNYADDVQFDFVLTAPSWYAGNVLSNALHIQLHPAGSLDLLGIEYSEQTGTTQSTGNAHNWLPLPTYPVTGGVPATVAHSCSLSFKFKPTPIGSMRIRVRTNNYVDAGTMKRYVAGIKHLSLRQETYVSQPSCAWCSLPSPLSPGTMYRIIRCAPRIANQSELTAGHEHVKFFFFKKTANNTYDPLPIGRQMMPITNNDAAIIIILVSADPYTHVTPLINGVDVTFQRA